VNDALQGPATRVLSVLRRFRLNSPDVPAFREGKAKFLLGFFRTCEKHFEAILPRRHQRKEKPKFSLAD